MKELVVVSGKGGTGKTSLTASLAVLAERPVLADCDVDAADLHLVLAPEVRERHVFRAGHEAVIRAGDCRACGVCLEHCRFGAVTMTPAQEGSARAVYAIDPPACEGCGVCVRLCPQQAIDFPERVCGRWMVSDTRVGPMVHARLAAGGENSGKLVTVVRQQARLLAEQGEHPWLIVDGPPGIGCPVIASLTGASLVLVVTEPTVSGEHDLQRVLGLARHFALPAAVCVNKWDLEPALTARIESGARRAGARPLGRVRYDPAVTRAQLEARAVVESDDAVAADIRDLWRRLVDWSHASHHPDPSTRNPERTAP